MDAITCIRTRQSIRAFRPEPVDRALLTELVELAGWSPSYKNTQPWEIVVVSGAKKEALSRLLTGLLDAGVPACPDLPAPRTWPALQQERITRLLTRRQAATGIDLADPAIAVKAKRINFGFYGAPHAFFLYQEDSLPLWSLFDLGLFAQNLMLAAHARGVGTVPQAFVTEYATELKDFLGIAGDKRLVLGMSVGYPAMDAPANRFRSDRAATDEILRFLD